jgi:hypothetical protein
MVLTVQLTGQALAIELPPSSFDSPRTTILRPPSIPGGSAMVVGDFNVDGFDDLLVFRRQDYSSTDATLYRGWCDGSFTAMQQLSDLPTGVEIRKGDFDGDGYPDLVIAGSYSTTHLGCIQVWLARPGGLEMGFALELAGIRSQGIVVDDFNGDGNLDFVVMIHSRLPIHPRNVSLFVGDGSGRRFLIQEQGMDGGVLVAGDFDGDQRPDLVMARGDDNQLWLARNDGTGQLGSPSLIAEAPRGLWVSELWTEDNDHDGDLDLFAVFVEEDSEGHSSWCWRWHHNEGDGRFRFGDECRIPTAGYDLPTFVFEDLNHDAFRDLLIGFYYERRLALKFGQPGGSFRPPLKIWDCSRLSDATVFDAASDGRPDLAVLSCGRITIAPLDVDGLPVLTPLLEVPFALEQLDFDEDGLEDLRVGDQVFPRAEDGGYEPPQTLRGSPGDSPGLVGPAAYATDFNGDGLQDIIMMDWCWPIPCMPQIEVWRGYDRFAFRRDQVFRAPDWSSSVTIGEPKDLDNDGDLDVVIERASEIQVLRNDGAGSFEIGFRFDVGNELSNVQAASVRDLNDDDVPDLLITMYPQYGTRSLRTYHGQGDGSFVWVQDISSTGGPLGNPVFIDIDGDDRAEIAISDPEQHELRLYEVSDSGLLESRIALRGSASGLVALDLDGDGLDDFVDLAGVTYWRSHGDGSFAEPQTFHFFSYGTFFDWITPIGMTSEPVLFASDLYSHDVAWTIPQGGSSLEPEVLLESSSTALHPGDPVRLRARIRGARDVSRSDVYLGLILPDGSRQFYADGWWRDEPVPAAVNLSLPACGQPATLFDLETTVPAASTPGTYTFVLAAFDATTGGYFDSMRLAVSITTDR